MRLGVETHLVASAAALPLMLRTGPGVLVEVTDGTSEVNAQVRPGVGFYYDLVEATVNRVLHVLASQLFEHPVTAVGVTPGWLRSERMLEKLGVTEETWRNACEDAPRFGISESPTYLARGVAALCADPERRRFAGKVLSARDLADTYDTTDVDGTRPDCRGLIADHGWDMKDPAVIENYR